MAPDENGNGYTLSSIGSATQSTACDEEGISSHGGWGGMYIDDHTHRYVN